MSQKVLLRNPGHALALGVAFYVAGSLLLWDAYERRGRSRPWLTKLLPGA